MQSIFVPFFNRTVFLLNKLHVHTEPLCCRNESARCRCQRRMRYFFSPMLFRRAVVLRRSAMVPTAALRSLPVSVVARRRSSRVRIEELHRGEQGRSRAHRFLRRSRASERHAASQTMVSQARNREVPPAGPASDRRANRTVEQSARAEGGRHPVLPPARPR